MLQISWLAQVKKKLDFYKKLLYKHLAPVDDFSASKELDSTRLATINHSIEVVIDKEDTTSLVLNVPLLFVIFTTSIDQEEGEEKNCKRKHEVKAFTT